MSGETENCPSCGVGNTVVVCQECGTVICRECGAKWEEEAEP